MATTTSFAFDVDFRKGIPKEIKLVGSAHRASDSQCLRLTQTETDGGSIIPLQNDFGRVIYKKPMPFSKETTFETTITFTIKPTARYVPPGDGLVFFMAPVGYEFPGNCTGGNLGIFGLHGEAPNVFAVEFDVHANPWDPDCVPHLGIDIGSRKSTETRDLSEDRSAYVGKEVTLYIKYSNNVISASVTTYSKPHQLTVIYGFDLSTTLPDQVEVGLAASTGELVAFHDVTAWEFYSPKRE